METKSTQGLEIKAEAEGVIIAYAATFNGQDSYGDTIRSGAFTKTAAERKDRIKVLYNHDPYNLPVGKPLSLAEDAHGLLTHTKMSRTQLGQDIYTLAQEGALSELSIGYIPIKASYPEGDDGTRRELLEVKLVEYSFVPMPADERALIVGVKSAAELDHTLIQLERLIAVDLKGNSPLAAKNLKRLQPLYLSLKALLEASEPPAHSPAVEAAESTTEPPAHSELLTELKNWKLDIQRVPDETVILAELKAAFAPLIQGART